MKNTLDEGMFSEEYSSDSTEAIPIPQKKEISIIEETSFREVENYSITKPQRVIIKAIIKND